MAQPNSLLYDLAHQIIDALEAYYADQDVVLPDYRYAHFGEVAIDGELICQTEQLVVTYVPGQYLGLPGAPSAGPLTCEVPGTAAFEVWLSRCVPRLDNHGKPPPAAELDASALVMMTDARLVMRGLYLAQKRGTLFDAPCRLVRLLDQRTQGPEGGFSSVVQPIEVALS